MPRTIEVLVSPLGDVSIDAVGFKGADCEQATDYLERALGVVANRVKKPEYQQLNHSKAQQRVGR
ncbi:MAG: DUF2997 domain-containing protein [Limisphaerales bacterium]